MPWIVVNEFRNAQIYWNEEHKQWSISRENATEFDHYIVAEQTAHDEGGWLAECTTQEPPVLESNTQSD